MPAAAWVDGVGLHVRSYGEVGPAHAHDFSQLVLPLRGRLCVDMEYHRQPLDASRALFVAPGAWHATRGEAGNQSLVLDLDAARLDAALQARLMAQPALALSPAAARLVDYMGLLQAQPNTPAALVRQWVPLLLDTLALGDTRPASRLQALLACVEAEPAQPWTVARMAAQAALSASRLHELFQVELATTPRAWLAGVRVRLACQLLAATRLPLVEVALRCGYADQSALTHAVRRATGLTPSAYRRQGQESGTKTP
ncbi:MAG: Virulence regulon transcriptional activator VirF [Paracidovorax wautersii]|uniref:Virulence regulon transcriptional activator VirF n=1 Tax=Paracidovorax wautersii TaxID=1177982 RepID=A0A7V8FQZ0_9BURK|nr:MAG: Virulence regulon transcriptional activator VirF [Paracidovorax wautersii]